MWLLLLCAALLVAGQDGGGQAGDNTPPPPGTTAATSATGSPTSTPSATTTPGTCTDCDGGTEINFDFKGLLAGAQGGDCDCSKQKDCSQCAYGVFGYPCIADPCDQCLCGGGLASPPGSACLPCEEQSACADDGSTTSTCLTGRDGPCEPTFQVSRKSLFLGGTFNDTDFYVELAFQTFNTSCHYQVTWASSRPVTQVRVFALANQFGTMNGANDLGASCFEGIRFKVVNTANGPANVNYNIVSNSLQYDSRFAVNGVPGLLYAAGSVLSPANSLFFGQSSTSSNFRDASRACPANVNGDNLPLSFKVVVDGGGIPASGLNNFMSAATAPNSDNIGTHWIMLPDRGVCVGRPELADQNDGSYVRFASEPAACARQEGCLVNPGPPVFASPASQFKKSEPVAKSTKATYNGNWAGAESDTP